MPTFWVLKIMSDIQEYQFFVDEGIDSGPIILQEMVEIGSKTQQELIKETKRIGMDLIIRLSI